MSAWLLPADAQPVTIEMPVTSFATPGTNTVGLVGGAGKLWASDQSMQAIFRWNNATNIWDHLMPWDGTPGPLAWDGEMLWVVDEPAGVLVRVDTEEDPPVRSAAIPIPLAALREVPSITGLTWDGIALWLSTGCGLCSTIYRIDPETGDLLQSFFPSCEPRGLAHRPRTPPPKGELWMVAYSGPRKPALLTRRRISSDPSTVSTSQDFHTFGLGATSPVDPIALAIVGGRIWVVDRNSGLISRYDPSPVSP